MPHPLVLNRRPAGGRRPPPPPVARWCRKDGQGGQLRGADGPLGPTDRPDRACEPAPVRKGASFNCRENAFEGPRLHRVIRRRVNVAELQGSGHSTISTASERQTSVTFPQSVQRASRPFYRPSWLMVRALRRSAMGRERRPHHRCRRARRRPPSPAVPAGRVRDRRCRCARPRPDRRMPGRHGTRHRRDQPAPRPVPPARRHVRRPAPPKPTRSSFPTRSATCSPPFPRRHGGWRRPWR